MEASAEIFAWRQADSRAIGDQSEILPGLRWRIAPFPGSPSNGPGINAVELPGRRHAPRTATRGRSYPFPAAGGGTRSEITGGSHVPRPRLLGRRKIGGCHTAPEGCPGYRRGRQSPLRVRARLTSAWSARVGAATALAVSGNYQHARSGKAISQSGDADHPTGRTLSQ